MMHSFKIKIVGNEEEITSIKMVGNEYGAPQFHGVEVIENLI